MKTMFLMACILIPGWLAADELRFSHYTVSGNVTLTGLKTNGICRVDSATSLSDPWAPYRSLYTTATTLEVLLPAGQTTGFFRASAMDLTDPTTGYANLTQAYGVLTTIAGAGGSTGDENKWQPAFEGGPATNALLSGPHIALADRAGNVYIADKNSHGIRKVDLGGILVTVAGVNQPGNGPDEPTPGTMVALDQPNGLWVREDGTLYILDLGNGKVRRLDPAGIAQTLFTVPGGILAGRGLWVNDDETLAYVASLNVVKKWTPTGGVEDFVTGFTQLGNLMVDPNGYLVVTDRSNHQVYRLDAQGGRTVIAGNGTTSGGGDGALATQTGLNEVRGVWFLPTGAFFVATHRGSQVWYVDTAGYIHLFLNGNRQGAHAGDGMWFYQPAEERVSECRAVTMDYQGHVLITENDAGYVRRVQFLPWPSP